MTKKYLLFILLLAVFFLSGSYFDYESVIHEQLDFASENGAFDNLPEQTEEILSEIGIDEVSFDTLNEISFSDIISILYESFIIQIKEPVYAVASIIASGIICAVAECFYEDFTGNKAIINAISSISAASVILMPMKNLLSFSGEVIKECSGFMLSFIPIYSSAITASGYVSSASGFRTLMLGASALISNIANNIIVPLICIYLALCVAGSFSSLDVESIAKSVKSFATWVLTLSVTVFSGIMGLGTIVSSSADGAFSKTAKFLIGGSIPIAGSVISDALSSLKGCISVTKNILGIYAIIVIAAIFIPPLISLICWRICLSLSAGINAVLGNKNLSGFISAASCVIGIMLALVSLTAVMFIFAITILLVSAGGI